MTTPFDAKMAALATRIVRKFEVSATWTSKDALAAVNPTTRVVSGASNSSYSVKVSPLLDIMEHPLKSEGGVSEVAESVLDAARLSFVPRINDVLTVYAQTWTVVSVETLRSGDDAAAYVVTVAR